MRRYRLFGLWTALALLALLASAPAAHAYSLGIASSTFGAAGCPGCHSGGTTPTVVLGGPSQVAAGDTVEYTLTIFGNSAQPSGGFNVAATDGTLSLGGSFATATRTILGLGGLVEITHSMPKPGDALLHSIEFSFYWTAPNDFSSATLRGWGNAVNGNGLPIGDAAALTTLAISVAATHTPAPTATPTPTVAVCGDRVPPQPAIAVDTAARACQAAIAKAGALYLKKDHKAVRNCLKAVQRGVLSGDPAAVCRGTSTVAPTDPKAAAAIAKAQTKARALLAHECTDAALLLLDACAATESALEDCFLAQHRQAVVDAVGSEYGDVASTSDVGEQKCQGAVGNAGARFLTASLKAAHKCLAKEFIPGVTLDGGALCLGSIVGGVFVPPTDVKAAAAAAAAQAVLADKILAKCDDPQLSALGACGSDEASTVACLLCAHRGTVFDLLAGELGTIP